VVNLRRGRIQCLLLLGVVSTVVSAGAQESVVTGKVELFGAESLKKEANGTGIVVWLEPAAGARPGTRLTSSSPPQRLRLIQEHKSFHPHILVVEVGASVEFPNHDPFFHNVFSLFEGKRFDLGLYEAGTSHIVYFDRPGVSYIFCNIHPEMSAVVLALDTPFFAVSNSKGNIAISGVPPGRYELRIWHERAAPDALKSLSREVTISEDSRSFGVLRVAETTALNLAHKNKYGQDYLPPLPSSPAYRRP
jgi:plastocyanin